MLCVGDGGAEERLGCAFVAGDKEHSSESGNLRLWKASDGWDGDEDLISAQKIVPCSDIIRSACK